NLLVESSKGGCECGRSVTMNQYDIRLKLPQYIPKPQQYPRSNIVKILPFLHQVEIIFRSDFKQLQHLIEHFPVLGSHTDPGVKETIFGQDFNQWGHFDRFRPGTEYRQNLHHLATPQKSRTTLFPEILSFLNSSCPTKNAIISACSTALSIFDIL